MDLNLKWSLRMHSRRSREEEDANRAMADILIEFQNQSNGGVSALTTRFSPVAGLTISS